MTFTDLLDEYFEAKLALEEAHRTYDGYSFGYFHDKEIRREYDAKIALENFIANKQKEPS